MCSEAAHHARQKFYAGTLTHVVYSGVVTTALAGIRLGEVVSAPGIEDYGQLEAVFAADLPAWGEQGLPRASCYR